MVMGYFQIVQYAKNILNAVLGGKWSTRVGISGRNILFR
jgi:hypothetical protein